MQGIDIFCHDVQQTLQNHTMSKDNRKPHEKEKRTITCVTPFQRISLPVVIFFESTDSERRSLDAKTFAYGPTVSGRFLPRGDTRRCSLKFLGRSHPIDLPSYSGAGSIIQLGEYDLEDLDHLNIVLCDMSGPKRYSSK